MSDIERRELLRGAVAFAALAGVTAFTAAEVEAGTRARVRVPRRKRARERVPIRIESENDIDVEGTLDLTTIELTRDNRVSTHVQFEITIDSFVTGTSVKEKAEKTERLAAVDPGLQRAPDCVITWGKSLSFKGVVEGVRVGYTMFLPDGTPVRATCSLRFAIQPSGGVIGR